jgi:hypothetical protein
MKPDAAPESMVKVTARRLRRDICAASGAPPKAMRDPPEAAPASRHAGQGCGGNIDRLL